MIDALKRSFLDLIRTPSDPPATFGEERSLLVFRAAPAYFQYLLLGWMARTLVAIMGLVVGIFVFGGGISLSGLVENRPWLGPWLAFATVAGVLLAIAGIVLSLARLRLDYELRWYKVTERGVRIREGVFTLREMTMTFANIQNTSISQGPLQRMLGIADIKLESAGGGGGAAEANSKGGVLMDMHTAYFRGVENAEEIRQILRNRMRDVQDAGLGDLDDAGDADAAPAPSPARIDAALLAELRGEASAFRAAAEHLATARGGAA